jgi:hypothetical protein
MKKQPYIREAISQSDGAVDRVLEDSRLSPTARIIAAYCVNRPDRWKLGSENIREALGLGLGMWSSARRQLIATGYLSHFRIRDSDGLWAWVFEVTDIRKN